jgi:hypothetical protein
VGAGPTDLRTKPWLGGSNRVADISACGGCGVRHIEGSEMSRQRGWLIRPSCRKLFPGKEMEECQVPAMSAGPLPSKRAWLGVSGRRGGLSIDFDGPDGYTTHRWVDSVFSKWSL